MLMTKPRPRTGPSPGEGPVLRREDGGTIEVDAISRTVVIRTRYATGQVIDAYQLSIDQALSLGTAILEEAIRAYDTDPMTGVAGSTLDTLQEWARSCAPLWSGHPEPPTVQRTNLTTLTITQDQWEATWWVDLVFGRLSVRITGAWMLAIDDLAEWAQGFPLWNVIDDALSRERDRHMTLIIQPRMNRPEKMKEKPMKDERAPALPRFGTDYTPRKPRKTRKR